MNSSTETSVSADEATRLLGVRLETLYAYVSRGKVRSVSAPEGGSRRKKRYLLEDIQQLLHRKSIRHEPDQAGLKAMSYGMPILKSALSRLTETEVFIRGEPLSALATRLPFEAMCSWLWLGDSEAGEKLFAKAGVASIDCRPRLDGPGRASALDPLDEFQALLPALQTRDPLRHNRTPEAVAECGVRTLTAAAAVLSGNASALCAGPSPSPSALSIASALCTGLKSTLETAQQERLINAILVLAAEHELNASSFTARCVASTGASPYAAVNAGLCALRGPLHGGATLAVEELFAAAARRDIKGGPTAVVAQYLERGQPVPGFGHRIYRGTDPRAAVLFNLLQSISQASAEMRRAREFIRAMELSTGLSPNLDFALVTATRTLKAPPGTALRLFCLSRIAGFIAHTIEQYKDGRLLRPRAESAAE